jgi:aminomethyltransferase
VKTALRFRAGATPKTGPRLLAEPEVQAIGLGARDSLRLEAGLCLYGHDMNTDTTPIEASLLWAISKPAAPTARVPVAFPAPSGICPAERRGRKRVGLLPQERTPVREGAEIVDEAAKSSAASAAAALARPSAAVGDGLPRQRLCRTGHASLGHRSWEKVQMLVSKMPFVPQRYYRG